MQLQPFFIAQHAQKVREKLLVMLKLIGNVDLEK